MKEKLIKENVKTIKNCMERILKTNPELTMLTFGFNKNYGEYRISAGGKKRSCWGYLFEPESIISIIKQIKKYDGD